MVADVFQQNVLKASKRMSLKTNIDQIKRGSSKAEKELFDASSHHLMTVALRYVVDQSAARDVLQESYIRIFQKLHQFQYETEVATLAWMKRITAREAIRWLKKQQRWKRTDTQLTEQTISKEHPMFNDDLYQNLLVLATDQRLVFNMYAIEGYSHKEIAKKLQIAESSSRSLLSRARKILVEQFKKKETHKASLRMNSK